MRLGFFVFSLLLGSIVAEQSCNDSSAAVKPSAPKMQSTPSRVTYFTANKNDTTSAQTALAFARRKSIQPK